MQQLTLKNAGLFTAPNPFSEVPPGAMVTADNVVIDSQGILESRRGNAVLAELPDPNAHSTRFVTYQSKVLTAYGNSGLAYYNGSAYVAYSGSFSHPDSVLARLRFLQASSNLYLTTNAGIYKLDSYLHNPAPAGMYPGLDITTAITGSSGFLSKGTNFLVYGYSTNASADFKGVPNTAGLSPGQYVTGTYIPAGTTIVSILGSTITLSQNASGTNVTLTTTAGVTSGSTSMVGLASTTSLAVGNFITGQGITTGTTVASISGNNVVLSLPATLSNTVLSTTGTTATSTAVTALASTVGIVVGMFVTGSGVPANTTVSAISGTGITLSQATTSSVTGVTLTFFSSQSFVFYSNDQITVYTGSQCAYRQIWGIKDANKNIIYGSPTGRVVATNTGTTACNVNVTFSIPSGVTTAHFFQIYRTLQSNSAVIDPGDEEQLVYEGNPSSGQLSAGTITVLDSTPDSLLGAALYTNASEQGISQSFAQPPLAWDFASFRNFTFYANTISKQSITITLLASAGSSGIQVNDTITISGVTYTAKGTEAPASAQFKVFSAGTPAQNIADTAQSLVRVINQYSGSSGAATPIYATYISGVNDLPGMIFLSERAIGGAAFAVTVSAHGSAWNPQLPTSGTSVSSNNSTSLNGLYYSIAGQPEAVPLQNFYLVGSAAYRILRILPLQNSLLILKEVEGVFRLTGYNPSSFVIDSVDSSTRLLAPDTAVVLNNQIWCLTDQGVTTVTDTGSGVISRPIENLILPLFGQDLDGVKQYSTGINYDTDRKYILYTISGSADTAPTQAFVFNTFTRAFTRWPLQVNCGFVNPIDDKLYQGSATSANTLIERKSYSYLDYVDAGTTYTITSASGTQVVLTSTNQITIGDRLYQSSSVQSLITDVQPGYVTVQDTLTWAPGDVTVFAGIDCLVEWVPISVSNPGTMKQCPEISLIFKQQSFNSATLSFASDVSQSYSPVTIRGNTSGLWGLFPWGEAPWGGPTLAGPIRTLIPLEKQRCSELRVRLEIRQGFSIFQLAGMSIPVPDDQTYAIAR